MPCFRCCARLLPCPRSHRSPAAARAPCPELEQLLAGGDAREQLRARADGARAEMAGASGPDAAALYARQWLPKRTRGSFVVMQFNVLAEGLSADPGAEPPLPRARRSDWGGFGHVPARQLCLGWRLRRWRLLEEVLRCEPDLLAMEEVDHFEDFFLPALQALGYDGRFVAKPRSPCVDFGYFPDGTAIFWRTTSFTPVGPVARDCYTDADGARANQVYAFVDLRHSTGEVVRFAATHLKAKAGQENESLRAQHVEQLLRLLSRGGAPHVVLCGDFNSDPFDVEGHRALAVPAVLGHRLGLASAYPLPESAEGAAYTTWKRRGPQESRHVIDYIFHSPGLLPGALFGVPDAGEVSPDRLPGCQYPSDHVAIAAELAFRR